MATEQLAQPRLEVHEDRIAPPRRTGATSSPIGHASRPAPTSPAVPPVQRRGVGAYLVIAFGLAWLPFAPALVGADPVVLVLMPVAPALACIVVRRWVTREGFADAGLRPQLRHWPFYLLALAWPLAVAPLSVLAALALDVAPAGFEAPWGLASPDPVSVLAWLGASLAAAPFLLGEELGWRGFLQPRVFPHRPVLAAVATGLVWGVWHYPLILTGGEPTADRAYTLVVFPVGTVALSVFLGWLTARASSVWPASVAHAAHNVLSRSLTGLAFTGSATGVFPSSAAAPILLAEASVFLGVVVVAHRRRRGAPRRRPQSDTPGR